MFERRFCYFDIEDFCSDAIRLIISAIDNVVVGHAFHVTLVFFSFFFCFIVATRLSTNVATLFFCSSKCSKCENEVDIYDAGRFTHILLFC